MRLPLRLFSFVLWLECIALAGNGVCLLPGCIPPMPNEQAWSRWSAILFATGKGFTSSLDWKHTVSLILFILTLLTFVDLCMRVEYKSLYLSKGSAYAISSGNFNADYCMLNRRLLRLSNAWSKFDSSSSSKFDGSYSSKKLNKKSVVLLFTNPNQILTVVVHQKSN